MTGPGDRPLVSVLTPSYNQARFLPDCLRSVRDQTYENVEHIVMDGGSDDGTLDVLREAGMSVVWESRPDKGQSEALNRALSRSAGEIIGWLNSDDAYYRPSIITQVVEAFVRYPEVDVIYGHAALVNDQGLILHTIWVPPFSARLLRTHNFIIQPAAFIRRSAIVDSFVDENLHYLMDRELWLRLSATRQLRRIGTVLAIDRHHSARKVMTMQAVGAAESKGLEHAYRVRANPGLSLKLVKILQRWAGLSLIPACITPPHAFAACTDGLVRTVLRQVAMVRRAMPMGS